jgi:hypothetical protein
MHPTLFHQQHSSPVVREQLEQVPSSPSRLVEMISNSKSFIIQASIALIILAASLTSSVTVNAASIMAPACQFLLFFGLVVREGLR